MKEHPMPTEKTDLVPISVQDFAQDWLRFVLRLEPNALTSIDGDAIALAIVDLAGAPAVVHAPAERIEAIATFLPRMGPEMLKEVALEAGREAALRLQAAQLQWLFNRDRGSSITDPELREARKAAMGRLAASVAGAFVRAFTRSVSSEERSRSRHDSRWRALTAVPEAQGSIAAAEPGPETVCLAHEAADRIVKRLAEELTPRAFNALRACLLDPAKAPDVLVAEFGVSAATLSRAHSTLRSIVEEECPDRPPEFGGALRDALYSILTAA
jgi:hypothetical protein